MNFHFIETDKAGSPPIPSSQGAVAGGFVFTSGHGCRRPDGTLSTDSFRAQLVQTISNIREVLRAGGSDLTHCVRMLVLLSDRGLADEFNEIYAELMPKPYPPRMTMVVGLMSPEVLVEMHAVGAVIDKCAD